MRTLAVPAAALAAAVLLAAPLRGQVTAVGVRGGLSVATFSGSEAGSPGNQAGFVVGGFATLPIGRLLAFQPELLYPPKGAKWDVPGISSTGSVKLHYLEVPLLVRVNIPASADGAFTPYIAAGPFFALKARCEISVEDQNTTIITGCDDPLLEGSVKFKSTEAGVTFGAGTDVRIGKTSLVFDGRYDLGLTEVDAASPPTDIRNRAFMFTVGVRLFPPPSPSPH